MIIAGNIYRDGLKFDTNKNIIKTLKEQGNRNSNINATLKTSDKFQIMFTWGDTEIYMYRRSKNDYIFVSIQQYESSVIHKSQVVVNGDYEHSYNAGRAKSGCELQFAENTYTIFNTTNNKHINNIKVVTVHRLIGFVLMFFLDQIYNSRKNELKDNFFLLSRFDQFAPKNNVEKIKAGNKAINRYFDNLLTY